MESNKKQVICVTCKKEVTITPVHYGNGYIASCPRCGQLAYNGK